MTDNGMTDAEREQKRLEEILDKCAFLELPPVIYSDR
jgi:hypothetical protein